MLCTGKYSIPEYGKAMKKAAEGDGSEFKVQSSKCCVHDIMPPFQGI
jgi:hypothetical protein